MYSPQKISFVENTNIIKISAGTFSGSLTTNGELYLWGKGAFGEFFKPTLFSNKDEYFIDFQINNGFGLALDSKSEIYSWGENDKAQLGIGNLDTKAMLTLVKRLAGKNINKFSTGISNFCIGIGDFIKIQLKNGNKEYYYKFL